MINSQLAQMLKDKVARNLGAVMTQEVPRGNEVTTRIVRTGSDTTYYIEGPTMPVLDRVETIERDYPSMGYGTRLCHTVTQHGRTEAVVHRWNSCD
jgi:hypothetical protein